MLRASVFGKTDVGRVRECNEDALRYYPEETEGECPQDNIYIVADGVGGAVGGEMASRLTVETVKAFYAHGGQVGSDFTLMGEDDYARRLEYAVKQANRRVYEYAVEHPGLEGMGSTVVAIHFVGGKAYIAHVGDSRCYRIRGHKIEQLTRDHSYVQQLYDAGEISEEEMRTHPQRNVITRALGNRPEISVEITEEKLKDGDLFLLCSDGLSGYVSDEAILDAIVGGDAGLEHTCADLIELSNAAGGEDNITVLLARVSEVEGKGKVIHKARDIGNKIKWRLTAATLVLVCLGIMWITFSRYRNPEGKDSGHMLSEKERNRSFLMHISSNKEKQTAIREVETLMGKGFDAFISLEFIKDEPWYKVYVGGFCDVGSADSTKERLKNLKLDSRLNLIQRPYAVQVGDLYNSKIEGTLLGRKLKEKGYFPYFSEAKVKDRLKFRILIGAFETKEKAEQMAKQLKGKGVRSRVVLR